MALTTGVFKVETSWSQTNAVTGFNSGSHSGPWSQKVSPTISGAACNRIYVVQSTLAASATVTIDLRALTAQPFNESLTGARAYTIQVYGTGATWRYDQGAANPLAWFFGGTTPQINGASGDVFGFGSTSATTVDATNRNVRITNTHGSATLTYKVAIMLGV